MIDPKQLAASTLQLLQTDPRNYRNFGVYWFLIKELLKRYYTRDNLFLLGDYIDHSVVDRMPAHADLQEALAAAIETYRINASYAMGSADLTDPEGETFTLIDADAGGL
ncbi:hypothetical protein [Bordetella phage vB_BbrM_PHB04]|uniref:Uncharacterized protein n=1 Tax=Bordetella phage vB_BbrM_PHB04 TaxID=2029657 RepID=A0A291LA29_9CAUD|nr:Ulx-like anti-restriction [Bordetella phage vB_BbrM_PHB04]ATI15644.1 hypothetical protein [Bordetella phage vB_BbrM_PHB04]